MVSNKSIRTLSFSAMLLVCSSWGRAFHVDADSGSNAADGKTAKTAWKTFDPIYDNVKSAGDTLRLKRGCTWKTRLQLYRGGTAAAPIVVTSYGDTAKPLPRIADTLESTLGIASSNLVLEKITVNAPRGYCVATLAEGLKNITLQDMNITDCRIGIQFESVDGFLLRKNTIHDVHFGGQGSGAIALVMDRCKNGKVVNNVIRNAIDGTGDAEDGGGFELFRTSRNIEIAWNQVYNVMGFLEMGGFHGDSMCNIGVHHNTAMEVINFAWCSVATPKDTSDFWGVGYREVYLDNNTHIQNRRRAGLSIGVSVSLLDSTQIRVRNNLIAGDSLTGFIFQGPFQRSNNIYWSKKSGAYYPSPYSSGESKADPKIVIDTTKITYVLGSGSPALGKGAILTYPGALGLTLAPPSSTKAPDIGSVQTQVTSEVAIPVRMEGKPGIRIQGRRIVIDEDGFGREAARAVLVDGSGRELRHWSCDRGAADLRGIELPTMGSTGFLVVRSDRRAVVLPVLPR